MQGLLSTPRYNDGPVRAMLPSFGDDIQFTMAGRKEVDLKNGMKHGMVIIESVSLRLNKFLNEVTKKLDQTADKILFEYEDVFQGIERVPSMNKYIKIPYHPIPTFEGIFIKCANSKKFSKLHARYAYRTIELDDDSVNVTALNTPFGRIRYRRYPFGLNCAQEGIKQDPKKVRAIHKIPNLMGPEELQSLLGMVNYLGNIFQTCRYQAIPSEPLLSSAKQKCSENEKKAIAITIAYKYFQQCLYGRSVKVFTGHKPIESILSRGIQTAPPRLQCLMLQIQPYNFSAVHVLGTSIHVADALSRLPISDKNANFERETSGDVIPVAY
ncbi:hypothetical protein QYM36_004056 [Artemia franciscana]|uniref:Reverse transcriptase RNase H-like domain-containing protein n=1 Tax=Artemia franciscana TaxID=6661 RepID=A0AA88IFK7_ARTSF|nr:hypothetical protein QYM36_004056 [Artemia franciscana]